MKKMISCRLAEAPVPVASSMTVLLKRALRPVNYSPIVVESVGCNNAEDVGKERD